MNPQELSPQQRVSPQVANIDSNVAQVMANAGYNKISVPPGMTANPNLDMGGQPLATTVPQQAMQPNGLGVNPGSNIQEIEPNYAINTQSLLQPQQQQQPQQPQLQQGQSIAGRDSPYAAHILQQQQQQQQVQPQQVQPVQQVQPQVQFITGQDGSLTVQQVEAGGDGKGHPQLKNFTQTQQQVQPQAQQQLSPAQILANPQLAQQQQSLQPVQTVSPQQPIINNQPVQNQPNETQALQAEIGKLRQESESMRQMLLGQMQPQQQQQQEQKVDLSQAPKLADYIKDLGDSWDQSQALNPNTPSGAAYANWVDARDTFKLKQAEQSILTNMQKEQSNRLTQEKINSLAASNREFQDIYGRPDIVKIQSFWNNVIGSDWGKLKQALDMVQSGGQGYVNQGQQFQVAPGSSMQQVLNPNTQPQTIQPNNIGNMQNLEVNPNIINGQASQIVPLHTGNTPTGLQNNQVQLPQTIQTLYKTFGNEFELPANAQIV